MCPFTLYSNIVVAVVDVDVVVVAVVRILVVIRTHIYRNISGKKKTTNKNCYRKLNSHMHYLFQNASEAERRHASALDRDRQFPFVFTNSLYINRTGE